MKPNVSHFELHITASPDFTKRFGKRVKEAGGRYSECRGYRTSRYVHVPNTEEGRKLAQSILDEFAHDKTEPTRFNRTVSVVITDVRDGPKLPSWATVHHTKSIDDALAKLDKHLSSDRLQPLLAGYAAEQKAKAEQAKKQEEVNRQIESLSQHPAVVAAVETAINSISATSPIELTDDDYRNIVASSFAKAYENDKPEWAKKAS